MIEDMKDDDEEELGYIYHQNITGLTWKTCLLIDSKSSVDIFNNRKFLTGIHKVKKPLELHCYSGCVHVDQKGWFVKLKFGTSQKELKIFYPSKL